MTSGKLMLCVLIPGLIFALAPACGSSKSNGSGGSGGEAAGGGSAGTGGTKDSGMRDGSGGTHPRSDANFDAPFVLPDGGCGQIFCPAAVALGCPDFQSLNDCAQFCAKVAQTPCQKQWNAILTCAGPNPTLVCDDTGHVDVPSCPSQVQAMKTCLASDGG